MNPLYDLEESIIRSRLAQDCRSWRVLIVLFVVCTATASAAPPAAGTEPAAPVPIREIEAEGFRIRLDLGPQVLRLSVPEDKDLALDEAGRTEAPISPTLAALPTRGFVWLSTSYRMEK